jgi:hypothetical protein
MKQSRRVFIVVDQIVVSEKEHAVMFSDELADMVERYLVG